MYTWYDISTHNQENSETTAIIYDSLTGTLAESYSSSILMLQNIHIMNDKKLGKVSGRLGTFTLKISLGSLKIKAHLKLSQ